MKIEDKSLEERIRILKKQLFATRVEDKGYYYKKEVGERRNVNYNSGTYDTDYETVFSKTGEVIKLDLQKRREAKDELINIYKSLGYSSFGTWLRLFPRRFLAGVEYILDIVTL